jgi:deoxyribose-phosphate aldolase
MATYELGVNVRTAEDAQAFLAMADRIHGGDWADNMHYRFGASSLLANLLHTLGEGEEAAQGGY